MTDADLLPQLAQGEDSRRQFKRDVTNADALAAELAAFANSGGGTLFIGVNDDGAVAGLGEWPGIELVDDVTGNQFSAVIQRPQAEWASAADLVTPPVTDQVTDQVTREVLRLLAMLRGEMSRAEIQAELALKHLPHLRDAYLNPALEKGLIEMTIPDKPRSRLQKYRLTAAGRTLLQALHQEPPRP